jgi:hypothetical protein
MEAEREELRYETWKAHLHSMFMVQTDSAELQLQFTSMSERMISTRQERFSLYFKGPLEYFLPQHLYPFHHAAMNDLDLFIVPITQEPDGFVYEAVFNKIIVNQ